MYRVQQQMASNQWVDLSRSPQSVHAHGLAEVRRTVAHAEPVRVVTDSGPSAGKVDLRV